MVNTRQTRGLTGAEVGDMTNVEGIAAEVVQRGVAREGRDNLRETLGGRAALNCAMNRAASGFPAQYGDERFGIPKRDDLRFEILEKKL